MTIDLLQTLVLRRVLLVHGLARGPRKHNLTSEEFQDLMLEASEICAPCPAEFYRRCP